MKWHHKALLFKALSKIPFGAAAHQFLQRNVTRSIRLTKGHTREKIKFTQQYLQWLEEHGQLETLTNGGTHVDFGTGWHPTVPLLFYSLGVERQWILDVRPMLRGHLMRETVSVYREVVNEPDFCCTPPLKRIPPPFKGPLEDYINNLGIQYRAPYSSIRQEITCAVDCVTSSEVLLYIPPDALRESLRLLHHILKPGGVFIAYILLTDLYADADPTITRYNFYRFSPEEWDSYSSHFMNFNRLRSRDYKEALEECGFTIRHFDIAQGNARDLEELDTVPLHPWFTQRYTREELAEKTLLFVAEKPAAAHALSDIP